MLNQNELLSIIIEQGLKFAPCATEILRERDNIHIDICCSEKESYAGYLNSVYEGIEVFAMVYDHYDHYHEELLCFSLPSIMCLSDKESFEYALSTALKKLEEDSKHEKLKSLINIDHLRLPEEEINEILSGDEVTIRFQKHGNPIIVK